MPRDTATTAREVRENPIFHADLHCGAYEGHSILDFVAENRSLLQPHTVHSDSHGQSAPIFGLGHLLGIELMPRIRG